MSKFEYELRFLEAGADELEGYLLSGELYWPIGIRAARDEKPYPRLTLGNLLLSRVKAHVLAGSPGQMDLLARVGLRIDDRRQQWRTAWGGKATSEYRSRFNLWHMYLDDYRNKPEAQHDRYDYEINRRVLMNLILPDAVDIQDGEKIMLDGLDQYLRSVFIPGEFIWEEQLIPGFPEDEFWYLYGAIRER